MSRILLRALLLLPVGLMSSIGPASALPTGAAELLRGTIFLPSVQSPPLAGGDGLLPAPGPEPAAKGAMPAWAGDDDLQPARRITRRSIGPVMDLGGLAATAGPYRRIGCDLGERWTRGPPGGGERHPGPLREAANPPPSEPQCGVSLPSFAPLPHSLPPKIRSHRNRLLRLVTPRCPEPPGPADGPARAGFPAVPSRLPIPVRFSAGVPPEPAPAARPPVREAHEPSPGPAPSALTAAIPAVSSATTRKEQEHASA